MSENEKEGEQAKSNGEPVAKPARKRRCTDPSDTVDIVIGESGIRAIKPITVPQFCQKTFDKLPNGAALCWKNRHEDPWQIITYTQYKKLIYDTAKSFLKVRCEYVDVYRCMHASMCSCCTCVSDRAK